MADSRGVVPVKPVGGWRVRDSAAVALVVEEHPRTARSPPHPPCDDARVTRVFYGLLVRPPSHGGPNSEVDVNNRQLRARQSYHNILLALSRCPRIGPEGQAVHERFKGTVAEIERYYLEQDLASRGHHVTEARRQLDRMRGEQMLPLARLARRVFIGESAVEAAMRVPHKRAPTDEILTAATHMVKILRPHRAVLLASRIDPERMDRLEVEAKRLKKVFKAAYASVADRAMPTRRLPELFASAHADVLALDVLVAAKVIDINGVEWQHVRRVGKRMGRPPRKRRRLLASA